MQHGIRASLGNTVDEITGKPILELYVPEALNEVDQLLQLRTRQAASASKPKCCVLMAAAFLSKWIWSV